MDITYGILIPSREDWPEWVLLNGDIPPDCTYDTVLRECAEMEKQFAADGIRAVKVYAKPGEFRDWCFKHGHHVNSAARREYAVARLVQLEQENSGHG